MRLCLSLAPALAALLAGPALGDVATATRLAKSGSFVVQSPVNCAQEVGQSFGTCTARVARAGAASAVVVKFPNGFARTLSFDGGDFLRGNATMSGVGTDTQWSLSDGMYSIRVDDQRFEIPKTLVDGS